LEKLYVPEIHRDKVDSCLRGKIGLWISELAITEGLSAIGRRKREGGLTSAVANQIRDALLADAHSGAFARMHLDPAVHREAERLTLATTAVPLRTTDPTHLALAFSGAATHPLTFDTRLRDAALLSGLNAIDI
jgi:predicted nucleic acid-binding protein